MIDLHSDTIYCLECWRPEESLVSNSLVVSEKDLRENNVWMCSALFLPLKSKWKAELSPWERVNLLHDRFVREVESSGIRQMKTVEDLREGYGLILTTEEGASIEGDITRLGTLAAWGVKIFGFTWNHENELGFPNSPDPEIMAKGLKDKGFEAVEECERLGIVVDVSHLSDGGFWDVVKASHKPFFATHSNARALCGHPRNLTDEMIRALSDKGGAMGLNLYPAFVNGTETATAQELADHVEYIYKVGGEDVIAIGTDSDGFRGEVEVKKYGDMPLLFQELEKRGFSPRLMEKFQKGNAMRVLSTCGSL